MMFIKQGGAGGDGGGAGFAPGRPPPQLATQQHARATPSQLARRPPQQQEHLMDAYAHNRLTGSSPVPSFSPTHFRPPTPSYASPEPSGYSAAVPMDSDPRAHPGGMAPDSHGKNPHD